MNRRTQEAEAGELLNLRPILVEFKFQNSQGYPVKPCVKKKKKELVKMLTLRYAYILLHFKLTEYNSLEGVDIVDI